MERSSSNITRTISIVVLIISVLVLLGSIIYGLLYEFNTGIWILIVISTLLALISFVVLIVVAAIVSNPRKVNWDKLRARSNTEHMIAKGMRCNIDYGKLAKRCDSGEFQETMKELGYPNFGENVCSLNLEKMSESCKLVPKINEVKCSLPPAADLRAACDSGTYQKEWKNTSTPTLGEEICSMNLQELTKDCPVKAVIRQPAAMPVPLVPGREIGAETLGRTTTPSAVRYTPTRHIRAPTVTKRI